MTEKEEIHAAIKKFHTLEEQVTATIDTTESNHSLAYLEAEKAHLRDDKGKVQRNKLKDADTREKFVNTMTDTYLKPIKEKFAEGKWKELDETDKEMLLNTYAGTTKGMLKASADELKENYSIKQHESHRDNHIKELEKQLRRTSQAHFKEDDKKHVLKYIGADKFINQEAIKPNQLGDMLRAYKQLGAFTKDVAEKQLGMGPEYLIHKKK